MKYKCDSCKNETEEKYDLVLFACGIRLWLCKMLLQGFGNKGDRKMTGRRKRNI